MRITGVKIVPVKLPLLEPFVVPYGTFPDLATVLVRLETEGGLTGWGEGTPDPHVTGETFEGVVATLRYLAPALLGRDPLDRSATMRLLGSRVAGVPTAKAALDIALHDLAGHVAGLPVWTLLGGRARESLSISRVISLKSPEAMAIDATKHVAAGFRTVKLKVGDARDIRGDVRRVAAVRGEGGKLKYEFLVKPGSSVEDVRLAYRGAERLSVGAGGELLVQTSLGVLKDAAPVSYQRIGGERVPVESRYTLKGDGGGYGFAVGAYDPRYPLVIDPELDYSTFLGGNDTDVGLGIAVDGSGSAYVTGDTRSTDYPTTTGAYDPSDNDGIDAFVTKLNASGTALAYSTFLGGTAGDFGRGIAVDGSGRAYVTGGTDSENYPTTGAFDRIFNGERDAFVTKLNASGSALAYSTFLGGTGGDFGHDIAVGGSGRAYVTGSASANYPTTTGAFDTTSDGDAFVTKLPTG